MQILQKSYSCKFKHPDFGPQEEALHLQVIGGLRTATSGTWVTFGATSSATVSHSGSDITLSDGLMQLQGSIDDADIVRGVVIHQGVEGGSFTLAPLEIFATFVDGAIEASSPEKTASADMPTKQQEPSLVLANFLSKFCCVSEADVGPIPPRESTDLAQLAPRKKTRQLVQVGKTGKSDKRIAEQEGDEPSLALANVLSWVCCVTEAGVADPPARDRQGVGALREDGLVVSISAEIEPDFRGRWQYQDGQSRGDDFIFEFYWDTKRNELVARNIHNGIPLSVSKFVCSTQQRHITIVESDEGSSTQYQGDMALDGTQVSGQWEVRRSTGSGLPGQASSGSFSLLRINPRA